MSKKFSVLHYHTQPSRHSLLLQWSRSTSGNDFSKHCAPNGATFQTFHRTSTRLFLMFSFGILREIFAHRRPKLIPSRMPDVWALRSWTKRQFSFLTSFCSFFLEIEYSIDILVATPSWVSHQKTSWSPIKPLCFNDPSLCFNFLRCWSYQNSAKFIEMICSHPLTWSFLWAANLEYRWPQKILEVRFTLVTWSP